MRSRPDSTLPTNSNLSEVEQMKQLLDEREAIIASLKFLKIANQKLQEHLAGSFVFALIYTNGLGSLYWRPPSDLEWYDGMIWQEKDRWSCFVLVHYKTSVSKEEPQAISWDGISPLVTGPEGVAWEQQIAFEKEWRRLLDSRGRDTAVRYFSGGEAVLPRMEVPTNIPLLVRGVTAAEGSDQVIAARSTIEGVKVDVRGRQWLGIHDPHSLKDLSQSRH